MIVTITVITCILVFLLGLYYISRSIDRKHHQQYIDDIREIADKSRNQGMYLYRQAVQEALSNKGFISWEDLYEISKKYDSKIRQLKEQRERYGTTAPSIPNPA